MKSKGMTLVEVIVAIALLGVIVIFVFNLLVDIRQEGINSNIKSQDIMNRTVIILIAMDTYVSI